ncbi:arabinose operon control protein [Vibrio sp. B1FIG11]|uniref:AraC family transcriptional regulator n=1 Tax=Vibrio TaxID=662 RepID=UPI00097FACB9|nr:MULTISPECIES: AraC family transcriptional regulator [Vibrio]AQM69923.1 Nitrogen assimilation regulatory protein [Vibrio campbellii]CAD7827243.1 arabinose operon control protein [Vibrio sp. B1FIG11]CAE6963246.1 arabinose operon control protein [Vibrio sp. B1FIG11]
MNQMTSNSALERTSNREQCAINQEQLPHTAFPLLGHGKGIAKIKRQIQYASQVSIPVFISGEIGTEKRTVAYHIHRCRSFTQGRFIYVPSQIRCVGEFKHYLNQSIGDAEGGTLFLSEVDKLSDKHKDYLTLLFSNHEFYQRLAENKIQLIVSCTTSLTSSQQFLSKILGSNMPHLEVNMPSLRERRDDIPLYIEHFLKQFSGANSPQINKEAMTLLCEYPWPQNVSQLQKIMMVLISSHPSYVGAQEVRALGVTQSEESNSDLIELLLQQRLTTFEHIHPALYKSLNYISQHFLDEMSLKDVSNAAYTSASHLSFLFREHLNRSFKSILVELRVRFAKDMINSQPLSKITDVCLQSGFGDLSHFEKMFKRFVGCTPRQYRQSQRQRHTRLIA